MEFVAGIDKIVSRDEVRGRVGDDALPAVASCTGLCGSHQAQLQQLAHTSEFAARMAGRNNASERALSVCASGDSKAFQRLHRFCGVILHTAKNDKPIPGVSILSLSSLNP